MAELDDYNTLLLGDGVILYAKSDSDIARFEALRKRLADNLANPLFQYGKALEKLRVAMELYQTMMFNDNISEIRMAAGYIADFLSVGIACMNGRYFKQNQTMQISELSEMKNVPDQFIKQYKNVLCASSINSLRELAHQMISSVRLFIESRKPETPSKKTDDFQGLADWYQELCLTWRRVYFECEQKHVEKAFAWGCSLQHELTIIREEFALDEMNLMECFDADNLTVLCRRAKELEEYIINTIHENGMLLQSYDTIEDFLEQNQ